MLSNEQIKAIFETFEKETPNEETPVFKLFKSSNNAKWCISANHGLGVITWYEMGKCGNTIKYYDYLEK